MISGEQRDSEGGIWGMGVGHGTWDVGMVLFFPFVRRVERRQGDLVFLACGEFTLQGKAWLNHHDKK